MAKGLITHAYLEDTADAIRVLRGESNTYTPDEFGEKIIDAIPTEEVTDDIVSVTDAAAYPAEGLEFAIEPVQDLHGYDRPWPAGGGKNLYSGSSVSLGGNNPQIQDVYITNLPEGTYTISVSNAGRADINVEILGTGGRVTQTAVFPHTFSAPATGVNRLYWFITQNDFDAGLTVDVTNIQIESGSTATSYEPYANICPISGWTECNGERTGKNLFDENFADWEVNGTYLLLKDKLPSNVELNMSVTDNDTSVGLNGIYLGFISNYTGGAPVIYRWILQNNNINSTKSNLVRNVYCEQLFIYPNDEATFNKIKQRYNIQVELGNQATTYEPYRGTSIPITFPTEAGTVYGGKAKPILGKLVDGMTEVDLGDLTWTDYSDSQPGHRIWTTLITNKLDGIVNLISDTYKTTDETSITNMPEKSIRGRATSNRIYVCDSDYDTASDFATAVTGSKLVYELATPIEYDITPQQVQMLLGNNNVWCDTGDTTLEYKVDLSRFIAKLQAAQATPQLSLNRQAVNKSAPIDEIEKVDEPVLYDEEVTE